MVAFDQNNHEEQCELCNEALERVRELHRKVLDSLEGSYTTDVVHVLSRILRITLRETVQTKVDSERLRDLADTLESLEATSAFAIRERAHDDTE